MTPLGTLALAALVPAMVGPLETTPGTTFTLALCSGSWIVIAASSEPDPVAPSPPGCTKGCHGASHRKRNGFP